MSKSFNPCFAVGIIPLAMGSAGVLAEGMAVEDCFVQFYEQRNKKLSSQQREKFRFPAEHKQSVAEAYGSWKSGDPIALSLSPPPFERLLHVSAI
jgi:hypothetical protein